MIFKKLYTALQWINPKTWGTSEKSIFFRQKELLDLSAWELLFPEGMLEYFEGASAEKNIDNYTISLVERQLPRGDFPRQVLDQQKTWGCLV